MVLLDHSFPFALYLTTPLSALLIIVTGKSAHQAGHLVRKKSVAWGLSRTFSVSSSASEVTGNRARLVQGALATHFLLFSSFLESMFQYKNTASLSRSCTNVVNFYSYV